MFEGYLDGLNFFITAPGKIGNGAMLYFTVFPVAFPEKDTTIGPVTTLISAYIQIHSET